VPRKGPPGAPTGRRPGPDGARPRKPSPSPTGSRSGPRRSPDRRPSRD